VIPLHDDTPTETPPIVTIALIISCTLVFLYEVALPPDVGELFVYRYGAIPAAIFGRATLPAEATAIPPHLTILTSVFLHGGWMHLIGNMLYLWIFGNNVEDVMGHGRFIVFYLTCGIIAALSHAVIEPASGVPMVGASGAISGILGAYLLLFPRAQVLVIIPLGIISRMMYVPAALVLGLWFLVQVLSGGMSLGQEGGGVAFFAHIGGFLAGMLLIGVFKRPDVHFFAGRRHSSWQQSDW
jgi:membrane associated rhomboid family serine protease